MSVIRAVFKSFVDAQARAGQARAAEYLARMGYYDEAKKVMLREL